MGLSQEELADLRDERLLRLPRKGAVRGAQAANLDVHPGVIDRVAGEGSTDKLVSADGARLRLSGPPPLVLLRNNRGAPQTCPEIQHAADRRLHEGTPRRGSSEGRGS